MGAALPLLQCGGIVRSHSSLSKSQVFSCQSSSLPVSLLCVLQKINKKSVLEQPIFHINHGFLLVEAHYFVLLWHGRPRKEIQVFNEDKVKREIKKTSKIKIWLLEKVSKDANWREHLCDSWWECHKVPLLWESVWRILKSPNVSTRWHIYTIPLYLPQGLQINISQRGSQEALCRKSIGSNLNNQTRGSTTEK